MVYPGASLASAWFFGANAREDLPQGPVPRCSSTK